MNTRQAQILQQEQYIPGKPTKKDREQWELVLTHWKTYCDLIGLEGDLFLSLLAESVPESTIEVHIREYRQAREAALPTFYELIGRRK